MKKIIDLWKNTGLVLKIIIGMIAGIFLALAVPQASGISFLGTLFVGALRAIAPLLVFVMIINSLAGAKKGKKTNMQFIIVLYLLGNFFAALTALIASYAFPVTINLDGVSSAAADITPPQGIGEVVQNLLTSVVANPVESLANGNYIGLLVWACLIGAAMKSSSEKTKAMLSDFSEGLTTVVRWIIECAPFGILGLVFGAISERGLGELLDYAGLLGLLVGTMMVVMFVMNPLIVFFCTHKNPFPLVGVCLKDSFVTAFFTRSSAANIPVNMAICKRLGLNKDTYSVSIPLGATINMAGAAVTISILTLATVHTLNISVDFPTALILCVLSAISAAGTSGVAGGSLLLVPMACSLFGIPSAVSMQVVGIGFITGIVQDSCETGLNSSTDVLYTAAAEIRDRRLHPEKYDKPLPPVYAAKKANNDTTVDF